MELSEQTTTVSYRLDEDAARELGDIAWENRTTKSDILRRATAEVLQNESLRNRIIQDVEGSASRERRDGEEDSDD